MVDAATNSVYQGETTETYTYDHARQLTLQTNTRGQHIAYGWDA